MLGPRTLVPLVCVCVCVEGGEDGVQPCVLRPYRQTYMGQLSV